MADTRPPRAKLIIRGLSGQHLRGFLPGQDNRAARSEAVSGAGGWSAAGVTGHVTRDGIGEWPSSLPWRDRKTRNALVFVTWEQVLEAAALGCGAGHREAYEAAYAAWCAEVTENDGHYPGPAACRRLHEAEHALIIHGCSRRQVAVQDSLFPVLEASHG